MPKLAFIVIALFAITSACGGAARPNISYTPTQKTYEDGRVSVRFSTLRVVPPAVLAPDPSVVLRLRVTIDNRTDETLRLFRDIGVVDSNRRTWSPAIRFSEIGTNELNTYDLEVYPRTQRSWLVGFVTPYRSMSSLPLAIRLHYTVAGGRIYVRGEDSMGIVRD
jgi:hypothetical protein